MWVVALDRASSRYEGEETPEPLIGADLSPFRTALAMVSGLAYLIFASALWFTLPFLDFLTGKKEWKRAARSGTEWDPGAEEPRSAPLEKTLTGSRVLP